MNKKNKITKNNIYYKELVKAKESYPKSREEIYSLISLCAGTKDRETIPEIKRYLGSEFLFLRAAAVRALEEFECFNDISHSGLNFPGVLNVEEIKKVLLITDNETLKYLLMLMSPEEKGRIIEASADEAGEKLLMESLYRHYTPEDDEIFNLSIAKINRILELLQRAGDIDVNRTIKQSEIKKSKSRYTLLYIKRFIERQERYRAEFKKKITDEAYTREMIFSARKLQHEITSEFGYEVFFKYSHMLISNYGILSMKMFINNIDDEFLKSGLQLLFDGRSSEEMVSIMIPRKERLIREYEATLDFILKGLRGYTEIKSTEEYIEWL